MSDREPEKVDPACLALTRELLRQSARLGPDGEWLMDVPALVKAVRDADLATSIAIAVGAQS